MSAGRPESTSPSCVVGMGAGRSGTSLAMSLLEGVGLRLGGHLVPADEANPDGHYEDARIVSLQRALMRSAGFYPLLPRPTGWRDAAAYPRVRTALDRIVTEEVAADDRIWGFKDPQTCSLWPMWDDIFTTRAIIPSVFFCFRPSSAVVASMVGTYGLTPDAAEAIVLYRTLHAFGDLDEPVYVVDHGRWRRDPARQLADLARHCGLDGPDVDHEAVLAERYRPSLDRRSDASSTPVGGLLGRFDGVLADAEGTDYDAEAVAALCRRGDDALDDLAVLLRGIDRLRHRRLLPSAARRVGATATRAIRTARSRVAR